MSNSVPGRSGRPPRATGIAPAYDKFLPDAQNEGKYVVMFEDGSFTAYAMDEVSACDLLKVWARPDEGQTLPTAAHHTDLDVDNPLWQRITVRALSDAAFNTALQQWLTDPDKSTVYLRDVICAPCKQDSDLSHFNQFASIDTAMHRCRNPQNYE